MNARELLETLEAFLRAQALAADTAQPTKVRALAVVCRDQLRAQLVEHARQWGAEAP